MTPEEIPRQQPLKEDGTMSKRARKKKDRRKKKANHGSKAAT
ncbi:hypothetical protein AB0451_19180 [Streptomyces sp. NPDC052000]|nr:hypothetical protein [Streptomyces sp. NBC_01431]